MIRGALILGVGLSAGFYAGYIWHDMEQDPELREAVISVRKAWEAAAKANAAKPSEEPSENKPVEESGESSTTTNTEGETSP